MSRLAMDGSNSGNKQTPVVRQRCHRCRGSGRTTCQFCSGSGQVMTGRDIHDRPKYSNCSGCFGLKTARCNACGGEGWI